MNGIYGGISSAKELRPCIVTLENHSYSYRDINGEIKNKKIKALFHCWRTVKYSCYEIRSIDDGFVSEWFEGYREKTVGIVEDENGNIYEIDACKIKFVDNKIRDYSFPEMEK